MALTGVHLLLTYKCLYECDHCFVWGSPEAEGTMTMALIDEILAGAGRLGTVERIYFEGGEPFLFYPLMVEGMRRAVEGGFDTGIVTNAYWATCPEDAVLWLEPLKDRRLVDLSVSSDLFHSEEAESPESRHVLKAAGLLGIPTGVISIEQPCDEIAPQEGAIRYRGRAAETLVAGRPRQPWTALVECPHEDLVDPGRVHIDPLGYIHLCQGLVIGRVTEHPLDELVSNYKPEAHPIVAALLEGGPAELVRRFDLDHEAAYVEECHLCYRAREQLRGRFPELLGPGQMYGEFT